MTKTVIPSTLVALLALPPIVPAMPAEWNIDPNLALPDGFRATVVADALGFARHIAVTETGDIYVALMVPEDDMGAVALRDTTGDGAADRIEYFAEQRAGTGIKVHDGYLYYAENTRIVRWPLPEGEALVPRGDPEIIVDDFPLQEDHAAKTLTFDGRGNMYVNVGAPSNNCMVEYRTPGSPAQDPCDELELSGGVWKFDSEKPGQVHDRDGVHYATGVRNAVAIDWNPVANALYLVSHGRDMLNSLFPEYYSAKENADLPAEEFHRVEEGANLGWPYTYWDPLRNVRMIAPEYGGDGITPSDDPEYQDPLIAFPAHWAPNDIQFYTGEQFPEIYRNGAFIAFHGSWNRAPMPQRGYKVVFVPMDEQGKPGIWFTFADNFSGIDVLMNPGDAGHRPMGLAQGPDDSLYITDSKGGRIWKVIYEGD